MKRGVSLVELFLYAGLLALLGVLVFAITVNLRRGMEKPAASFRLQQNVLAVQRFLQRDLEETHPDTVRTYPSALHPGEAPGLSMASPRSLDGDRLVLEKGRPQWQKAVYYTLAGDGRLLRWEGPVAGLPGLRPVASPTLPSQAGSQARVVAWNLATPEGFRATRVNARGTGTGRLPLVRVDLLTQERSSATGRLSSLEYRMLVRPEN
ncbi:MAG: hypothetical protein AB1758_07175 [Candidatus Eremiobacterota bacterium]